MTSITLTTIVLNDAEDPSDVLVLDRLSTYSRRPTTPGRVQRVGGGGFRVITSEGTQAIWDVTANRCPIEDTNWIEDHAGRTVCVRDDAGRKFFAVYFEPDIEEVPRPRGANVTLQLTETTWIEGIG